MTPNEAYKAGLQYGPSDQTRAIACQDPAQALYYARDVDQCPRDETRNAVIGSPAHASLYAFYVDCGPRDDTREAASKNLIWKGEYERVFPVGRAMRAITSPLHAYEAARKYGPSTRTRKIACQDPYYAYMYARIVDCAPHDETRQGVLNEPIYAFGYAQDVDKGPRDDTRAAASKHLHWKIEYEAAFPAMAI